MSDQWVIDAEQRADEDNAYGEYKDLNIMKLKHDFLMGFSQAELKEFILSHCDGIDYPKDADFFFTHEDSFEEFCNERFNTECGEINEQR